MSYRPPSEKKESPVVIGGFWLWYLAPVLFGIMAIFGRGCS